MRALLLAALGVLFSRLLCAQPAREFPLLVRDRLVAANESLLPAPAGWGIPLIGVRNSDAQHLASLVFYNETLHPFSEISLPQTVIDDVALPIAPGAPLVVLASRQGAFWFFPVDAHRDIGGGVPLAPGEHGVAPAAGAAVFAGMSVSSDSARDTLAIVLFSFFDQPLRHVIAAYTLRGAAQWQVLVGGGDVHARVIEDLTAAHDAGILFSTDAAAHESGDTVRLSARKASVGVFGMNGVLQWYRPYGAPGTTTWCVASPAPNEIVCGVRHADSAELVALDVRDGRERHFARLRGAAALRTLCATADGFEIGLAPNVFARFDTSLRAAGSAVAPISIDSHAQMLLLPGRTTRYLFFSPARTAVLDGSFTLLGTLDSGMVREPEGLTRFAGAGVSGDTIVAAISSGGALRAIEPNGWWWWFRYRAAAAIVCAALLVAGMMFFAARRFRFYRTYYNQLVRGSVTTGVVAMDRQMRVIHVNNAARELLHIAPYIPLQRHITEYLAGPAYADILAGVRDCLQTRAPQEKIITLQTGGQPRTLLSRARPTMTRNGMLAGCLLQLEDVTRTIERERLMSWASVAHHVAHEMKTPIGTVMLNAQHILKSEEELPLRARKYFHRIVTQAERLSGILQNFLSIARVSTMRFAPTDVARLVQTIAADYAELLPAHITLACRVGQLADAQLELDEQQLTTALRNILDNAVHAITPGEGSLTIAVDEYPIAPAGGVVISVRDTGRGMTEECRARMFEPFYTETPGGSGIGMVIVKRIVDEHRGFIEVESAVGVGTEVRIVIPRGG